MNISYNELKNLTEENFEHVNSLRSEYEKSLEEILTFGRDQGYFDIKDVKDENLKFSWDKNLGSIILRVNSKNNEDLYSKLVESGDKSGWFSVTNKREEKLIDNIKSYTQLGKRLMEIYLLDQSIVISCV